MLVSTQLLCDGRWLVAWVPKAVVSSAAWPGLDRMLARYAPWLADLAMVAAAVRERVATEVPRR
jgi:hypothetical protein